MTITSRREILRGLLGFGVLAMTGGAPISLNAATPVPLPDRPMRLSRRFERALSDGAAIIVERNWTVEFAPQAQGIAIIGQQISARVDAPAQLRAILEIEENRSTADMWPILLSSQGQIVAAGDGLQSEDLTAAMSAAQAMIRRRDIPATQRDAQLEYLAQLQAAGVAVLERLPEDLFYPVGEPLVSTREMPLPGGLTGEFELTYTATSATSHPWLDRAFRQVTTRIGSSQRKAREEWILAAF